MFIATSKLALYYQKLRDRYEYLRRLEPMTPCDPKCQEGWYWDCATETCKEYPYEGYLTTATLYRVLDLRLQKFNSFYSIAINGFFDVSSHWLRIITDVTYTNDRYFPAYNYKMIYKP